MDNFGFHRMTNWVYAPWKMEKCLPNNQAICQHALNPGNAWISLIFHYSCDCNCNHCWHGSDFSSIYIMTFNDRLDYSLITLFRKNLFPYEQGLFFLHGVAVHFLGEILVQCQKSASISYYLGILRLKHLWNFQWLLHASGKKKFLALMAFPDVFNAAHMARTILC